MNSIRLLVSLGLLVASTLLAQARIERMVEKNFSVSGAGVLRVETQGGEIRVMPSADGVVRVTARERIRADTEVEADEVLKKLTLTFEQSGNDVRVISKCERRTFGFFGSSVPVQVDVTVALPASYATDLRTSGGNITVGDFQGKAELRTSGGRVRLGKMGSTVAARTSGGDITLDQAASAVELHTSGGHITTGTIAGGADLSTSGGNIKVDGVAHALRAHTSGGAIRARITGTLRDECSLTTSGGSVSVSVDPAAAFRLDASTSGGIVNVDGLKMTIEKQSRDRQRLTATVNGGGQLLKLHSSGGGIAVRAN